MRAPAQLNVLYIVYSPMPNIFGWLSCDYSLIGGRFTLYFYYSCIAPFDVQRPLRDLLSIIFRRPKSFPKLRRRHPTRFTPHMPPLKCPSYREHQLLVGYRVFHLSSGHLRPSHHLLSIFDVCCFSTPKHANQRWRCQTRPWALGIGS